MNLRTILFLFGIYISTADSMSLGNIFETTTIQKNASQRISVHMRFPTNCSVFPMSTDVRHDIKEKLDSGVNLIIIELIFPHHSGRLPGELESDVYKPFLWERSKGRHGQSMLFLKTGFQILSLFTLNYGTEKLRIEMTEDPKECLLQRNIKEIEMEIRHILLNDFGGTSPNGSFIGDSLGDDEHVCNTHIRNISNRAEFYHVCCHKTDAGSIECEELKKDIWLQVLLYCIYFMNLLAVMYCPYLIPSSWVEPCHEEFQYEFHATKPVTLKIEKTNVSSGNDQLQTSLDMSRPLFMKEFKKRIFDLVKGNENTSFTQEIDISKIYITVKRDDLIPPNDVPVRVLNFIYNQIFRCRISEESEDKGIPVNTHDKSESISVQNCCKSSIFMIDNDKKWTWNNCLRKLMLIVYLCLLMIPWLFRIFVYYEYENAEYMAKQNAANERKLEIHYAYFPGSFVSFLTPLHILFFVCYSVFIFDTLLFGVLELLKSVVRENLTVVLRKCFRDMSAFSLSRSLKWSIGILVYPFSNHGVFAFIYVAFYWLIVFPLVLVVLIFYNVPMLNMCIRFLSHLILLVFPCVKRFQKKQKIKIKEKLLDIKQKKKIFLELPEDSKLQLRFCQFIIKFLCLLALLSCVIMAVEVTVFFAEMAVYTLIGVILHASKTLIFVSLFFMISIYARECFGSVHKKYQHFNQIINRAVLDFANKKNVIRVAKTQSGTAFQVRAPLAHIPNGDLKIDNGILKVKIPGTVLFFNSKDAALLTRKFYFEAVGMEYEGCPGRVMKNFCQALSQFTAIVLFLLFVVVVVLAFGNEHSMSGLNQMLATLAGGLIPLVLRQVLFKTPKLIKVDAENVFFKSAFSDLINQHEEKYVVSDIEFTMKKNNIELENSPNKKNFSLIWKKTKAEKYIMDGTESECVPMKREIDGDIVCTFYKNV